MLFAAAPLHRLSEPESLYPVLEQLCPGLRAAVLHFCGVCHRRHGERREHHRRRGRPRSGYMRARVPLLHGHRVLLGQRVYAAGHFRQRHGRRAARLPYLQL